MSKFLADNSTIVRFVTPIYYLEGQGEQTASSPTDSLAIKFEEDIDQKKIKEMIGELEAQYSLEYIRNVSESQAIPLFQGQ